MVLTNLDSPPMTYAISRDLSTVTAPTSPVIWAIGMLRDPVVQFTTASGATERRIPYWRSKFTQNQDIDIVCLQPNNKSPHVLILRRSQLFCRTIRMLYSKPMRSTQHW